MHIHFHQIQINRFAQYTLILSNISRVRVTKCQMERNILGHQCCRFYIISLISSHLIKKKFIAILCCNITSLWFLELKSSTLAKPDLKLKTINVILQECVPTDIQFKIRNHFYTTLWHNGQRARLQILRFVGSNPAN